MNLKDRLPAPLALLLLGATAYSHAATPIACNALLNQTIEGATITSAVLNVATPTLPEHCEVLGNIGQHTGADGQAYSVKFHLRMPTSWSERFYYQGGGGLDGSVGGADAAQINQGYAVVSTDSGHDAATNISAVAGNAEFGFDPQARLDYGYDGPARVAQAAKAITRTYYGQKIKYAYFEGCSEGGREGLMFSQRYPDLFDGVIAGNPGMDLPKAAVAEAWDTQAFAGAARSLTPFGFPDLATSFTSAELSAIGDAILKECDGKDGLVDGIISNPQACRFDPRTLGPQGSGLLSASQVTALKSVFDGARDSKGRALYAGWFWDPGIAAPGWRLWKLGPLFPAPGNTSLNTTLGGSALPFVFTTPPNSKTAGRPGYPGTVITTAGPAPSLPGLNDAFMPWLLSYNMDVDAPKIYARSGIYSQSAMDFMGTSSTDYRRFRAGGSKLIVYSGQADPVFSSKYHIGWYRDLMDRSGGVHGTQQFARLFVVPGMNHCGGGYATSQFDAFSALVKWVEQGQGPSALIGTAPADTPWPGRTRPICAYPAQPRYVGHGSIEDAANFTCVAVRDDDDDQGNSNGGNGHGQGNGDNNRQ